MASLENYVKYFAGGLGEKLWCQVSFKGWVLLASSFDASKIICSLSVDPA